MRKIDVCLSPDLIELYDLTGKVVVVVDILRATSCMTTGIAHGVNSIKPVATLAECQELQFKGYTAAAERNGKKVDGFDLGNSPFDYMDEELRGKDIAVTTTNGTLAITKSMDAEQVIIGSFLNFSAIINYLKRIKHDVVIHCAGWKGKVNMEDSLYAGAVVDALNGQMDYACDAPKIVHSLYLQAKGNMLDFMQNSSHAKRLTKLSIQRDIEYCLKFDEFKNIPVLKGDHLMKMGISDMLI
mgnify:CR=1 FL=1